MIKELIERILYPRCPYEQPPDTVTSDEEREEFEREQRAIDRRLRWLRYQIEHERHDEPEEHRG